jgi:hypothetical protein
VRSLENYLLCLKMLATENARAPEAINSERLARLMKRTDKKRETNPEFGNTLRIRREALDTPSARLAHVVGVRRPTSPI